MEYELYVHAGGDFQYTFIAVRLTISPAHRLEFTGASLLHVTLHEASTTVFHFKVYTHSVQAENNTRYDKNKNHIISAFQTFRQLRFSCFI